MVHTLDNSVKLILPKNINGFKIQIRVTGKRSMSLEGIGSDMRNIQPIPYGTMIWCENLYSDIEFS